MVKDIALANKKIYDPVHGFIRFDEFEKELIDSIAFQRLHYIHQLGIAYYVYPGATHTRFEHSIGVMELSTKIYDKLCETARPDLFHFIPRKGSAEYVYWKKVLRLAALCHDLGHLPFSHVAEDSILPEHGHEKWSYEIIKSSLEPLFKKLDNEPKYARNIPIKENILKLALGEKKLTKIDSSYQFSEWERILSEIISGDFFGADRMDYLLRDSRSTGIVYGLFDYQQLIESLRVLPSLNEKHSFELGIDENGLESCEALLIARLFMHKRVYQYSAIRSYAFHLKRFICQFYEDKNFLDNVENYLSVSDIDIIKELQIAAHDKKHQSHEDAKTIFFRKNRFQAIELSEKISEEDLQSIQKKIRIPSKKIAWEFTDFDLKKDFSFPIAQHHLSLEKAKHVSSFLSNIPQTPNKWVFIDAKYEYLFLSSLKEFEK